MVEKGAGMNHDVIITCAVTGAGDTTAKHSGVPVTPESVADAAISAAQAGAAGSSASMARTVSWSLFCIVALKRTSALSN